MFSKNKIMICIGILLFVLVSIIGYRHFSNRDKVIPNYKVAKISKPRFHRSSDSTNYTVKVDDKNHKMKYKKINQPSTSKKPTPPLSELEGDIDKNHEIRTDILQYIQRSIPVENKKARDAAMKIAMYQNKIYFHSANDKEAMQWMSKLSLAMTCLYEALPDNPSKVNNGITKLMVNTSERDTHISELDSKYFNWKIISTGLTDAEEKERCKSGNY